MWQWKESKFWIPVIGSLVDLQGAEFFWRSRVLHKVIVTTLPAHSWSVGRFLWTQPGVESCSEQYANPWCADEMLGLDKTRVSLCRPGLLISHPCPPSKFGISFSRLFFHGIRDQKVRDGGMKMSSASCLFCGPRCNHALKFTHPPTHVEDWAVGSPSESFKRFCKALTTGNKMWFLFCCDREAGRCAQWRVVLINLQHFEL